MIRNCDVHRGTSDESILGINHLLNDQKNESGCSIELIHRKSKLSTLLQRMEQPPTVAFRKTERRSKSSAGVASWK